MLEITTYELGWRDQWSFLYTLCIPANAQVFPAFKHTPQWGLFWNFFWTVGWMDLSCSCNWRNFAEKETWAALVLDSMWVRRWRSSDGRYIISLSFTKFFPFQFHLFSSFGRFQLTGCLFSLVGTQRQKEEPVLWSGLGMMKRIWWEMDFWLLDLKLMIGGFVLDSWFVFRWPYGAELEELSKKVARLKSPAASPVLHGLAPNLCIVAPRPEGWPATRCQATASNTKWPGQRCINRALGVARAWLYMEIVSPLWVKMAGSTLLLEDRGSLWRCTTKQTAAPSLLSPSLALQSSSRRTCADSWRVGISGPTAVRRLRQQHRVPASHVSRGIPLKHTSSFLVEVTGCLVFGTWGTLLILPPFSRLTRHLSVRLSSTQASLTTCSPAHRVGMCATGMELVSGQCKCCIFLYSSGDHVRT